MTTDTELLNQLRQLLDTANDKALKWADERGGIQRVDQVEYREECYQEAWDEFWNLAGQMEVTHEEYSYPLGKRYEEIMRGYLALYEGSALADDAEVESTHIPVSLEDVSRPLSYSRALVELLSILDRMGIPVKVKETDDSACVVVNEQWEVYLYSRNGRDREYEYTLNYKYPDGTGTSVGTVTRIALVLAVVTNKITFK